jgi:hypothetical protein
MIGFTGALLCKVEGKMESALFWLERSAFFIEEVTLVERSKRSRPAETSISMKQAGAARGHKNKVSGCLKQEK